MHRRLVGERGRLGPEERLGGTGGRVDRPQIDAVDDAQLRTGVHEQPLVGDGRVGRRGDRGHRHVVADHVGLVDVEEHQEARAQAIALPRGDGVAGERAPVVDRLDRELGGCVDAAGAGEDRLDRTNALARVLQRGQHDRLGEELTAEHHVALAGVPGVHDRVPIGADALGSERQRDR